MHSIDSSDVKEKLKQMFDQYRYKTLNVENFYMSERANDGEEDKKESNGNDSSKNGRGKTCCSDWRKKRVTVTEKALRNFLATSIEINCKH